MRKPIIDLPVADRFQLAESFFDNYRDVPPPWGFGLFSELVYQRTYSREMPNGEKEQWADTARRVTEGTFSVLKWHCLRHNLPWSDETAQEKAQTFFDGIFNLRWTPPGRGLWMMGTEFMYERGSTALNNCGFVSTRGFSEDPAAPFVWAFTKSMHGVGVGYNVDGTYDELPIQDPELDEDWVYFVEDSREGWANVIRMVIEAFTVPGKKLPLGFDMTTVRPKGAPIKGFGGVASGPKPLADVLIGGDLKGYYSSIPFVKVETDFNNNWDVDLEVPGLIKRFNDWRNAGRHFDSELIVDVFNMLGRCVVSGGVRRSAMISLGAADDTMFMDLKVDHSAPESGWWRWCSNNSIMPEVGDDYCQVAERIGEMGEPGMFWRKNAQDYGRMCDPPNYKDVCAEGTNPCCEQTLESYELCCLVETRPCRHATRKEYLRTLKDAYLYAKAVTLVPTDDPNTNKVMMKNRRIGLSMTGVRQNMERVGKREHYNWCDSGYKYIQELDEEYSNWLGTARSIKTTSVKPSGTVSLLCGSTPGVHAAFSEYMVRRMRLAATSPIVDLCRKAGIPVEKAVAEADTFVIEYPIHMQHVTETEATDTIENQFEIAAEMQRVWADNQVSCTVKFRADEAHKIEGLLTTYDRHLKGISLMKHSEHGYAQAPYEAITPEEYADRYAAIDWTLLHELLYGKTKVEIVHDQEDKFCDGDACLIPGLSDD